MSIKFSQFNAVSSISSSGYIVGYDGANNVRIKTSTADRLFAFTGGSLQFVQLTNAMVPTNTIGIDKLVNLAGLSVLGNATNASAAMAAITAANDNEVLLRSGTSLVFSKIGTDNINNSAITFAKIQNITPQRFVGRNSSPAGPPEEVNISQALEWLSSTSNTIAYRNGSAWAALTAGTNGYVLRLSGGALGFGQIDYTSISFSATQRVLGRNTAGAGTAEEVTTAQILEWLSSTANTIAYRGASAWTTLTASTNGHVLRLTGGVLGFGQIATGGIEDAAVTYAKIQNVSATSRVLGRKTAGAGVIEELTTSELLDFISSTQGSILYRGASGWAALGPGTSGQVLQTNGASADPSWATSTSGGIGGSTGGTDNSILRADGTGGATLQNSDVAIDDATTSTQANVTIANIHSGQTNSSLVLSPKGTGALILGPKPNAAASGGNARGVSAVDLQVSRTAATKVASGANSAILSGSDNLVSSANSAIVGGVTNTISGGQDNFIGSGNNNQILSGIIQNQSVICGGQANTNTALRSFIGSGQNNRTNAEYSSVVGGQYALTSIWGQEAYAPNRWVAPELGNVQRSIVTVYRSITGTSATPLSADGGNPTNGTPGASSATRLLLSTANTNVSNRAWTFRISLLAVCRTTGGSITAGDVYGATYEGVIKRVGTTTSLVGTVQTVNTWSDGGFVTNTPTVTITADDTNEALDISWTTVGGDASTVVRVNATVHLTEIGW